MTILLVTHLMAEAERLCDRIVLIDAGRVVATGTPAELAARSGSEAVLRFVPSAPVPAGLLDAVPGVHAVRVADSSNTSGQLEAQVEVRCTADAVQDVLVALAGAGIRAHRLRLEQRTLEDAFVDLTTPNPEA